MMQRCTRHTRRLPVALAALLLATALVAPRSVGAQAGCGFVMGFKALHDLLPAIVGDCLEEEHVNPANGNTEQRTTGGLLVWRAADNWTAFTDGSTTWINGPYGLQSRPNVGPLFAWEAGAPAAEAPPRPGAVLLADDFNDPVNGILPVRSGNPTRADRAYLEGEYVVRETDPGLEGSPISTLPGSYADAALAVDAKVVGPAADRVVMLACRQQADANSHYRLGVRPAGGLFELVRWDGRQRVPLADWQPSAAIRTGGAANRIELHCDGSTIRAVINGAVVATVQDATYAAGRFWIGAGHMLAEPTPVDVRFDDLVVSQL